MMCKTVTNDPQIATVRHGERHVGYLPAARRNDETTLWCRRWKRSTAITRSDGRDGREREVQQTHTHAERVVQHYPTAVGAADCMDHRRENMRRHWALCGALVLVALSGGTLVAQDTRVRAVSVEPQTNMRAEQLRKEAEALYEQPRRLRRAAELHEREAAQRKDSDPRQAEALDRAARLYSYSGDAERGRMMMERAARSALKRGDVARAAHAFIDAAFIALREGDRRLADDLTQEADLLALSPLLPTAEKAAIVRRIDPARAQLSALGR